MTGRDQGQELPGDNPLPLNGWDRSCASQIIPRSKWSHPSGIETIAVAKAII
jgi:hypothetical protein